MFLKVSLYGPNTLPQCGHKVFVAPLQVYSHEYTITLYMACTTFKTWSCATWPLDFHSYEVLCFDPTM